jgi:predicted metal-dependent phosphoesterase TrpH
MSDIKIDLHTHSVASPDGALTIDDYRRVLESGQLDYIAVTDHNTIDFAQRLQAELGERIVVGEEITTTEGEIIGLYLEQTIPKGLTPTATIKAIRQQGGLVCIPHPFETVRSGMSAASLLAIAKDIDIIEVHNGRALFQNRSKQAYAWSATHGCRGVANSDCHGASGWGRTYTIVKAMPQKATLLQLLNDCQYITGFPGVRGVLYPKLNRLKKAARQRRA